MSIINSVKCVVRCLMVLLPYFVYIRIQNFRFPPAHRPQNLILYIDYINKYFTNLNPKILDVGARLGLCDDGYKELINLNGYNLVGIEPDANEADRLESTPEIGKYSKVHKIALGAFDGESTLYITKLKGCSSIREPNYDLIKNYHCSSWFELDKTSQIPIITMDHFMERYPEGFDIVKIDVQGAEVELLKHGQSVLSSAIGISLEAQFNSLYKDQKLFTDLHELMLANGFRLIKLQEESKFYDGECAEANCAYLRNPELYASTKEVLIGILFCLMSQNTNYVEFIIRTVADDLLPQKIKLDIVSLLKIKVKQGKLQLLGPHN